MMRLYTGMSRRDSRSSTTEFAGRQDLVKSSSDGEMSRFESQDSDDLEIFWLIEAICRGEKSQSGYLT